MLTQMLHALTFFFTRLMAFFKGLSSNQTINGFKASRFFINIKAFDTLATINFQKFLNLILMLWLINAQYIHTLGRVTQLTQVLFQQNLARPLNT